MDLRFYFVVNILTVLLIHEVVFSQCDLKTKTNNHFTKSNVDGFRRKERQTPDPSRMYLPPKIDSVASSGFGGQIDASINFGNGSNGYGEIENVQDTSTVNPTTDFNNYDLSPTTINDESDTETSLGLFDTITRTSNGPVASSLDQSNDYSTLSPGGNNFGQILNKNNDDNSGVNLPEANNNYGTSLGTTSIPTNNGVTSETGMANGYGQNELLKTAQSQGPSKYNYNGATTDSQFGQNPSTVGNQYSQQGTVENTAGGYGNIDLSTSKSVLKNNNRISDQNVYGQGGNGNIDPNKGQSFSVDNIGYGDTVPNSFGHKYTNGEYSYSQNGNGNMPKSQLSIEKSIDISNNLPYISSVPNIQTQDNPTSKSTSQSNNIINGNYERNEFPNSRDFRAGGYNPGVSSSGYEQYPSGSNQGISATSQTYGQNDFERPNSNSYSSNSKNLLYSGEPFNQLLPINNGFKQSSTNAYNQKPTGINKNQIADTSTVGSLSFNSVGTSSGIQSSGTSYQNSYGQIPPEVQSFNQEQGSSNYEDGFNLNPQSQLQGSNNFGQSGSHSIGYEENYNQISPAYNEFNQNQQNQQLSNSYGPPTRFSQPFINGRNPVQNPSSGSANSEYNNLGRPSIGPYVNDQSRPTTSRISNNYSQTRFQPSSSSGNGYSQNDLIPPLRDQQYQESLSNVLNGFEQNSLSTPGGRPNNYGPVGFQSLSTTSNNFNQNSPTIDAYSQGALQGSKSYGQNVVKPYSVNKGNIATTQLAFSQNGLSRQSSGQESSSSLPGYGQNIGPCASRNGGDASKDKTSKGSPADPGYGIQNQKNSDLPSSGNGVQISCNGNNNGANNGEPGANSFSNFAPGNQPNQPINPVTNSSTANNNGNNYGEPGANSFSNFAPGNQPNQPINPGANSFSNFAPGNQPNQPINSGANSSNANNNGNNQGEPGANSFSNFAPGNQPNQPINPGTNNCDTNKYGNSMNKAVVSPLNTGY
ncbi:uncharacterized protein DDB_G0283357-like [Melanaphis sacchari]|uniref:uncharacterized protein DDB_G0283357-like n=1 Tax=Melanaphis sacchari TaxID=742174 RepID=UPI000DC13059|nr:uncharacterized protein DDB_G0283357-like [Melanaphis sacchari]